MIARAAVTWRYLPGRQLKHALQLAGGTATGHRSVAVCGIGTAWYVPAGEWRGSGSQAEYDHVARVSECKRCAGRLSPATRTLTPVRGDADDLRV